MAATHTSKGGFTKEQWIILTVIGSVHFGCAICHSIQAPFYPAEAELKGATATEYGLVFGIFELISFIASPILGNYMHKSGTNVMLNIGIFSTAACSILFGFLDYVSTHLSFISLSFVIRIIEALGASAATTAAFALTAAIFPDSVATTFATLEIFYGLGYIVGPLIGGGLYSLGGYMLPFVVMGVFLMIAAFFIYFLLPKSHEDKDNNIQSGGSLLKMLAVPDILLDSVAIAATTICIGYYTATLEPHLRMFNLTPLVTGVIFVISGTMYAIAAPLIGRLCDKKVQTKKVIAFGTFAIIVSFVLVGPLPGVPLPKTLWMCILGLVINGFGNAAILVPCFSDILTSAINHGFSNDLSTFGMVSGIWASAFSLGAFVGPSVAGALYDAVGFSNGTLFPIGVEVVVLIALVIFIACKKKCSMKLDGESKPDPEATHQVPVLRISNLPMDIPPLTSKCSDNVRPTGYGSFGTPTSFHNLVH